MACVLQLAEQLSLQRRNYGLSLTDTPYKLTLLLNLFFITSLNKNMIKPMHPGKILLEEFLKPLAISQYKVSKDINVPARRINEIVHGNRAITADTALRLGKFFGNSAEFWLNLQSRYELELQEDILADRLEKEVQVFHFAV